MLKMTLPLFALAFALQLAPKAWSQDRITGRAFATRSEVMATGAMVATSQPLATQAGLEVMRAGGNAIDAAIAANAVLTVVEPTGCGIGGDLFAILWSAEEEQLVGLNGSGRSPRALTSEVFAERGLTKIPSHGVLPISVPGCVDGWFALHDRFGKLPIEQVLAPAIRYAKEGFPVTELIAYYWGASVRTLARQPGFLESFTTNGRPPAAGEIFARPDLARTLGRIATGGRDAFYTGEIAETMVSFVREHGGFLSLEDLSEHHSEWVDPVSTSYRGVELWELPPNGQGIAALQILNLLEGYDLRASGFGSPDHIHWFTEAKKLAFADRAKFYADPDFAEAPVASLISKPYAEQRRALIHPRRAARQVDPGDPKLEQGDTIYLATGDAEGNMVSLIQSNYRGMGSGIAPTGLGFIFQDRGELFDLEPGRANSYAPGKRPFHTIIPAFLTRDGKPWIAYGVMGGATQPQAHAQIVCNLIDFDMGLQEAGDAPRILHSGSSQPTGERMTDGGDLTLESGLAEWEVVRELLARGHQVSWARGPYGGYQAVMRDPDSGVLFGASESRKDGQAAGY